MTYSNVLEVAKNRQMGIVDHLVGMYYELESRRLKNTIAEHVVYGWQDEPTQVNLYEEPSTHQPQDNYYPFGGMIDNVPF